MPVRPASGPRTWTVIDEGYQTVVPVEAWLEAHRHLWSPNTVRGYATVAGPVVDVPGTARGDRPLARGRRPGGDRVPVLAAQRARCRAIPDATTDAHDVGAVGPGTLEARLAALISFYRWQEAVFGVAVAGRLLRGAPRRAPARRLLSHLDGRCAPGPSSLVRVRRHGHRGRPPLLLPAEIQAILDGCAVSDGGGDWVGNLRDRLLFALLAETGCRLGEVLGMRISDFVMGRGGTAYVEVVPRADNANGARVKMMRPRRVYVGADLERLFADYVTHLACRADELGLPMTADAPLLVNLQRASAARRAAGGDRAGQDRGAAPQGHRPTGLDATLVPAQPRHRAAAGRHPGVGGVAAVGARARADHNGPLRLGSGGRGAARGGELGLLHRGLAGAR